MNMETPPQLNPLLPLPIRPRVPRIGGTAIPGGVHFTSGNYGTGPNWRLFLTGMSILGLGAVAMSLAYVVTWALGYGTGWPLAEALIGLPGLGNVPYLPLVQIGLNLLTFLCFLVVLRLSPLSGYHGAEHKVVHCLEHFGVIDTGLAWTCPRAHVRCGTTLLAGFLPLPLIAVPLVGIPLWGPAAAVAVLVLGWMTRFRVGAWVQNVFTTREPTPHQMDTAIRAAEGLLARWQQDPDRRVPLWGAVWVRGFPQMVAGVVVAIWVLNWVETRLPFWLDFTHVLH
jgi:hypothetical protein